MGNNYPELRREPEELCSTRYSPHATPYHPIRDRSIHIHEDGYKEKLVVTGAFPTRHGESSLLVETIRNPEDSERLMFLVWENGNATVVPHIEREGKIYVPPDPTSRSFPLLSLPNRLAPCGESGELLAEIASTTSKFVKLRSTSGD